MVSNFMSLTDSLDSEILYRSRRALSVVQETAQLLTGSSLPQSVLKSLILGANNISQTVGLINLSPYDACLEKVALRYHVDNPGRRIKCLTLGTDLDTVSYSEKLCALHLMEAKGSSYGKRLMESVVMS